MFLPIITTSIILGKAFDLFQLTPPVKSVFEPKDSEKMRIENTFTRTEYKLVESSADVNDFLDVQGELSLKMKRFNFDATASGSYLKESVDRSKTVELLLRMTFENYTETFPSYINQVDGWYDKRMTETHFIRSIVYGGQLIITYRMKTKSTSNIEDIKAVVKGSLETSGSVNLDVQGKFAMINKAVAEQSDIEIKAFYTGLRHLAPTLSDLDSVFNLIDEYPKLLKTPVPVRFELESLNTLRPDVIPKQHKHNAISQILDDANDKYDDVRVALSKEKELMEMDDLPLDVRRKRFAFKNQAVEAKNKLEAAIRKLDMSKPFNPSLFNDAFAAYAKGGFNVPNRFTREISEIINIAKNYVPPWYPYTRAVNEYVHWGNTTCSLPSPEPIFIGYAVGAPKGFGSGSDVICTGPDPELVPRTIAAPPAKTAAISGLGYQDLEDIKGALVCARCQLENATAIITVPAKSQCPEGTKMEYEGFLATGSDAVTDPICIDGHPMDRHPDYQDWDEKNSPDINFIKPVWMKCSGEDCIQADNYVRCVVCSR